MILNYFLMAAMVVSQAAWFSPAWKIGVDPGPSVIATKGEVWPKPQKKETTKEYFIIRPYAFRFKVTGETCDILKKALKRYKEDIKAHENTRRVAEIREAFRKLHTIVDENFRGILDELSVNLGSPCESLPHMDMDEHYELRVNTEDVPNAAVLTSQSIWGILRGLETWSQLIYFPSDSKALIINSTSIEDFPRFPHRGLLIDTSRHFLPLRIIYSMLDAMAMSKMNVLHWHVTDDQSFPFQSRVFSNLSVFGAYAHTHVYTLYDVRSVISYAADRGIRVVPEFDTPGHTRSWGEAYPELLTRCYHQDTPDGSLGPMNPIQSGTYDFMKNILEEIKMAFPDSLLHLGGDEVDLRCWESNPEIKEYLKNRNWHARKLEEIYIKKIIDMTTDLSKTPVVWQEILDNGADIPNSTIIQVWKPDHREELSNVTKKGHKALLSSCWYLDSLNSGGDWHNFYKCDPHDFQGSDREKELVIGGEACMWGEVVNVNNVLSRVWPRACAAAERLWSKSFGLSTKEAAKRLEEHTCRMNRRKIPAQPPNGPGFCPEVNYI